MLKVGDFGVPNWFNAEVVRKVGNGLSFSFWSDTWRGDTCFRIKYPRLYSISTQKEALVGEVGERSDLRMEWNFTWRMHLFMWEEDVLLSLLEDLEGVSLVDQRDAWWWRLEEKEEFSVRSAYEKLESVVLCEVGWGEEEKGVFAKLWKCPTPSKVVAFTWKALHNRVPTKDNLARRNVLGPEANSTRVLCNRMEESEGEKNTRRGVELCFRKILCFS
jgi:hypothetical protein